NLRFDGQFERERGTSAVRAPGVELTAVILDNFRADGQAQPGAAMIVLRREERVEDMAHIASTNSTSVVSDGCQNAPALYGSFDMNRSRTALRIADGIFRVNDQVQKYLLDLMGISPRARQLFLELGCDENVLNIFLILAELDHISDDFVQIEQNPCRFGFGSKAEEILNDLTST